MFTFRSLVAVLASATLVSCSSAPGHVIDWQSSGYSSPSLIASETPPPPRDDEDPSSPEEEHTTRQRASFQLHLGRRDLDDRFWDSLGLDVPIFIGFEGVFPIDGGPLAIEVAYFLSAAKHDTGSDNNYLLTPEFNLGLRSTADVGPVKIFGGGGVALMLTIIDINPDPLDLTDSDYGAGLYVHGGVLFEVGRHFNVGVDIRAARGGNIHLGSDDAETDYVQTALVLAFGF